MLSHEALALFRQHIERHGDIEVDDSNRETYRELAGAGLMVVGNSFARGEESVYHVTKAWLAPSISTQCMKYRSGPRDTRDPAPGVKRSSRAASVNCALPTSRGTWPACD